MAAELVYDEEKDPWNDTWDLDSVWAPEPDPIEDPILISEQARNLPRVAASLYPSQFTEFAFRMPKTDELKDSEEEDDPFYMNFDAPAEEDEEYEEEEEEKPELKPGESPFFENFDFGARPYMRRIYDTPARRVLLMCARQVEKSTLLGNISLCYMSLVPSYRVLYVNSSATQAKTFSNDRIKEPIDTSPVLRKFTTRMLSANILEKQFVNQSKITLRYAFLNADRTRGIPAWDLKIDEFQDVLSDNIPVIEQCTAHAPKRYKRFTYAGTPKSLSNSIEIYWSRYSTQNQWVVPCERHGGEAGRFWNILGEKNIGKKSLVCEKCKQPLNPMAEGAQWAAMAQPGGKVSFEGYRIPQLMVPWKPWSEIIQDYERYPRDKFYNEVLGISYDSGLRPLTRDQVKDCCNADLHMADLEKFRALAFNQPVFCGIDWGTGENAYTVMTLATYVDQRFRVFYWHRFEGEQAGNIELQLQLIMELIEYFNVRIVGTDYGGGFSQNDTLVRKFGPQRIAKFQYMARANKKVAYNQKLGRFQVARTEVMSDIFNAIKRGRRIVEFPAWEEFESPHAEDMTNIFSEYNDKLKMIQYKHQPDKPDDSFHSLLYCWLASMLVIPRPDIIAPRREVNGQMVRNTDWGTGWQG